MPRLITCPQGHQWELPDVPPLAKGGEAAVCPVCRAPGECVSAHESSSKALSTEGELVPPADPVSSALPVPPTHRPTYANWLPIAGYEVLEELGRGGMGVVYKAKDVQLGRLVAIKFLPEQYVQDRRRLERFQREARTASALNHPHICTIHSMQEYEGQPFLVMELIEGQTLRALAGQHPSLGVVARLGRQVAEALSVAHAAGIVHRDIKPENIMVRDDGYVKVLDFSVACLLPTSPVQAVISTGEGTPSGTVVGTARYMSPEQARGETAGSPSDIFSLGIVLYELATGQHPFQGTHGSASCTPLSPSPRCLPRA